MASSEEGPVNVAQDSAPWKDNNLENSDQNNFKYSVPVPVSHILQPVEDV